MIVYREFSSLSKDLGFSGEALYSVSNNITKHYRPIQIPKKNGDVRQLYVPDEFLKTIQRSIKSNLLDFEEISPYASAYRFGASTKFNAQPHVDSPVLLKLDIRHFFDNLIYPIVKEKTFPAERYSEQNRILLSVLCVYKDALPQGAPTSPVISNIIMKDFDNTVGEWCIERNIKYTRYCDDMTFSGDFEPNNVIILVRNELKKKVASDSLTVSLIPIDRRVIGGVRFTSEGYKTRNCDIIKDGVLENFTLSEYGARKSGETRCPTLSGCMEVHAGNTPYDELIKKIDKGILVCRLSGGNPAGNGDFSGVAKNSFLIENGKITKPVLETMISGNLAEMLKNITDISKETAEDGSCVFPWVAFDGVTVSGK